LKCLIAIELKTVEFEPEFAGKMNYYLELVDEQLKQPDDNDEVVEVNKQTDASSQNSIALRKRLPQIEPSYFRKLTEDIRDTMSIEDAYPIAVFFCNLSRSLTECTQSYLNRKLETMTTESKTAILEVAKDLQKDGVGLPHSIISVMETLQKDHTTKT
jgi:hypothetical protein